ncbi:hypothetical protein [Yoonia sediminilitoris]|uniref:Uncharacterized protein n=1 Tax=Yoonia sediminilitoris TaxID=1286148 RepID=A0A2T6K5I3_9RHOB|nr:hypothetical protein [Yoonia sediminilitoris]PUB09885.1 hypothetical protein C8N45_12418 [Yoonia sediminilitoris]RCW89608.1 hypothetical protein DFP92_12418 [Yoonia sediminilitoris]
MTLFLSVCFAFAVTLWIGLQSLVNRRLHGLSEALPSAYEDAAFAAIDDPRASHLIPLAIDLTRKQRCTPAFDTLSDAERRAALFALAVETQPQWVVRLTHFRLRGKEKALVQQLRDIKSSQPHHPEQHFGAVRAQLQLRTSSET